MGSSIEPLEKGEEKRGEEKTREEKGREEKRRGEKGREKFAPPAGLKTAGSEEFAHWLDTETLRSWFEAEQERQT